MLKFIFVAASSLLVSSAAPASIFYQAEPSTSLVASPGFKAGGTEYFLLKLRIYHKAKGIAAFPDGGIPRDAFEGIYLFKLDNTGPQKIAELGLVEGASDLYFKSSGMRAEKKKVFINIPRHDKAALALKYEYFLFDPVSLKISTVADPGGEWPKETLSLRETNKLFRDFSGFDAAGLPNPLDYTPGVRDSGGLARLISKGLGERRLRLAAARRLMASGNKGLLRSAIADLDKTAASRKIYFWGEEKALLEEILGAAAKKGE